VSRREFLCRACGKSSRFMKESTMLVVEAVNVPKLLPSVRRTYECEHCNAENAITQPAGFWAFIDLVRSVL
jgi:hypothetical protein